jgi:DNA gyrase/topoisomerase IV subunit B
MSNFKILTDAEHMLARPGMYIGSTTLEPQTGVFDYEYKELNVVPGLLKIINEIIDNSVDEFIRTDGKYANKIDVTIDLNPLEPVSISVQDNGRGLPMGMAGDVPIPVAAWTKARSGVNFTDTRTTIGMNGVGSFATAVFSTWFEGRTCDGKKSMTVTASSNCSRVDYTNPRVSKGSNGTTVKFYPDLQRFSVMEFSNDHIVAIKDRLQNLAICFPGIAFSFNGVAIKYKNLKEIAEKFDCDSKHTFTATKSDRSVAIVIGSNLKGSACEDSFVAHSYVNGLNTRLGGTHVDYMMNQIIECLRPILKKKYKFDVSPNQIRQHLFLGAWISGVENLKFDSQTKERVTNTYAEISKFFSDIDLSKFVAKIAADESIIMPIVESQLRKAEAALAAELRKKNKDADKANFRKITKFTDASEKIRQKCMLFVTEGDSANSSILSARTPQIGSYPLRGKPLNALGTETKAILANEEITNFFAITGLKIGVKVNSINDLRFGKIVICTDADADGAHISGLLMATLYRFWPELFDMGVIHRFNTPIAKSLGKTEKFFYKLSEFQEFCSKNPNVKTRYLKGLGSSSAKDFEHYFNEIDKNLMPISIDSKEDLNVINLVFGKEQDSSDRRKDWLGIDFN